MIQWVGIDTVGGHWYSGWGIGTVGGALMQWVEHWYSGWGTSLVDKASSVAVGVGLRGRKEPPSPLLFLLPQVRPFMEQFSKGSSVECF